VREADLQRHLENGTKPAEPAAPRAKPAPSATPTVPGEQKPVELGSKEDFQLSQAIAYLKGEPVKGQPPTLANTKPAGAGSSSKPN
jgi:carboxyl-terminal processing protease